ncbi:MAG: hypothetical protein NUW37_07960 [Planctomycetes bacterium]|nr:hypothetical protein [Planctomycetota bacterium]
MSQRLIFEDGVFERLEELARERGFESVEELVLELLPLKSGEVDPNELVSSIDEIRKNLLDKYGEFPDSTEILREDRDR